MRTFLIALLATAALPAAALAQEPDGGARLRLSTDTDSRGSAQIAAQAESRGGWRGNRGGGDRAVRSAPTSTESARPARTWGGNSDGQARPARTWNNDGQARPERSWSGDGNRGRRFDGTPVTQPAPAQTQVAPPVQSAPQRNWSGDGNRGRRNWNGDTPRIDPGRGDGRTGDWNRAGNTGRRDWDRNNDGRPDWNRGDNNRRDWDRNNDGRRDWNRNDGRRDGNWNNNRRDFRQWDRSWRSNSRYDWQRYRSSNRYAYRLPRYAAPYGWNYGYRRQSIGAYLFAGLFAQDYWISDPWAYRLPPVYWPYQWVRYYNDALLIDTRSGYVVDSIPDIFWY